MDLVALAKAVAAVAKADVPKLGSAHGTPPDRIEEVETPALIIYPDSPDERFEVVHKGPGEQEWRGRLYGQLLIARQGETPAELSAVNDLIQPLVDVFGVDGAGLSVAERHPDQFGYGVYRCLLTAGQTTRRIGYGGSDYTGTELYWEYRFDRITGSA